MSKLCNLSVACEQQKIFNKIKELCLEGSIAKTQKAEFLGSAFVIETHNYLVVAFACSFSKSSIQRLAVRFEIS